jgi:hypothetical protein
MYEVNRAQIEVDKVKEEISYEKNVIKVINLKAKLMGLTIDLNFHQKVQKDLDKFIKFKRIPVK